jgi:hypothetical protein
MQRKFSSYIIVIELKKTKAACEGGFIHSAETGTLLPDGQPHLLAVDFKKNSS